MATGDIAGGLNQAQLMSGGLGMELHETFAGTFLPSNLSIFVTGRVVDGAVSAALTVPLPLNAVVRTFDVVVEARQAELTAVKAVAQLRDANQEILGGDGMAVVIDFGVLRTVSAVQVPLPLQVMKVTPWIGMGFAPNAIYFASPVGVILFGGGAPQTNVQAQFPSTGQLAYLDSEVRTERLLVEIVGTRALDALAEEMAVLLPEAPNGLDLRLEGGATIWSHPAPVQPTAATGLTDAAWNKDARRIVHAGPTLAALTGDPTNTQPIPFTLTLTSRAPGILSVTEHARAISVIRRILFDGDPARILEFDDEGAVALPLALPPAPAGQTRGIEAVRFTAIGTPPPERVIPPVGPEPAGASSLPVLADIVLSADRAAIVRLRPATGLAELTGIRLPLTAGSDGAEVRTVLWRNKGPGLLEPAEVLPGGTSDPVALPAGAGEAWVTLPFPAPVGIDDEDPAWAAVLVSRGTVTWSLGAATAADDPFQHNIVRIGAPTGPWKPLPAPFQSAGSALAGLRGRVRAMGLAPKEQPLAPLQVTLAGATGAAIGVTPSTKGAQVAIAFNPPLTAEQPVLSIVSLCAETVTLRDIDVVSTN